MFSKHNDDLKLKQDHKIDASNNVRKQRRKNS